MASVVALQLEEQQNLISPWQETQIQLTVDFVTVAHVTQGLTTFINQQLRFGVSYYVGMVGLYLCLQQYTQYGPSSPAQKHQRERVRVTDRKRERERTLSL